MDNLFNLSRRLGLITMTKSIYPHQTNNSSRIYRNLHHSSSSSSFNIFPSINQLQPQQRLFFCSKAQKTQKVLQQDEIEHEVEVQDSKLSSSSSSLQKEKQTLSRK